MFKKCLLSIVLLAASFGAYAGKIVVFDAQQALLRTKVAQEKFDQLTAKPEYTKIMQNAESLKVDLEAMSKEANSKGMTWSDQEKADHRKKMEYVQADLKLAAQKIQAERNTVMNAIVTELQPKLEEVIGKYLESQDIDLVLRKEASFVAKPAADITQEIAAELDKMK